jgi:hypothetical protein
MDNGPLYYITLLQMLFCVARTPQTATCGSSSKDKNASVPAANAPLPTIVHTISPTNTATNPISVYQPYAGSAASCCNINGTHSISCCSWQARVTVQLIKLSVFHARTRSHVATKMMFWALSRVSLRSAKIVSCNKDFFFHGL